MTRGPLDKSTNETRSAFWPSPRPRALFFGLLAWIAFSLAVSLLLSPPVHAALCSLLTHPPHFRRVVRRVVQAAAIAFAALALRRLGVRTAGDVGLGAAARSAPRFGRSILVGFCITAGALGIDFAAGARQWDGAAGGGYQALGLVGAALVAFVEEGIFRGALLFPFGRLRGAVLVAAAGLNSALFATVHFVRGGMRGDGADFAAAWAIWREVPGAIGDHLEMWVGLFAVGIALYLVARRQGDAWGATGLHLGSAFALQLAGRTSDIAPGASSLLFVEGLLPGFGFAALLAVSLAVYLMATRQRGQSPQGPPGPAGAG